ncbi:putative short-chain dehydrogenase [Xylariaceae sp. FL0255]|nr:putative short-chain dehydrogenase [Xylariaceae sp. FL0255]
MEGSKETIVLTGANGGFGRGIIAKITSTPEFARYHGCYLVRNVSSAAELKAALRNGPPSHSYDILELDLSSLSNVRELATSVTSRVKNGDMPPLHSVILNAGYNNIEQESSTPESFDTAFSMNQDHGRIVVIGSNSYDTSASIHEISGYYKEDKWNNKGDVPLEAGVRRYGVSKMCAIMMVGELQSRLDSDPVLKYISITALDPGSMGPGLTCRGNWFTRVLLWPVILPLLASLLTWFNPNGSVRTISKSSLDALAAAFSAPKALRGKYLNGSELEDVVQEAADTRKRTMVWRDSVRYYQLREQDTALAHWA